MLTREIQTLYDDSVLANNYWLGSALTQIHRTHDCLTMIIAYVTLVVKLL